MIKVEHLSRRYGEFVAVKDVSFDIGHGEIVGLLGHNGAGKTTIMKMITGYLEPSDGQIWFNNQPFDENPGQAKVHIGYLPENLPVYPDLSVADYLLYTAKLRGLTGAQALQAVRNAIADTELEAKVVAPIATLSRGYKQRVGVAQAILHNPRLLILDEPTNGLDPQQTQAMRDLLTRLAKNATVVLSTHIMQEVEAICDRVLMMRQGELVLDERLATLRHSTALQVTTSMPVERFKSLAIGELEVASASVRELAGLGDGAARFEYRVPLRRELSLTEVDQHVAQLTRHLVEAGAQVFRISPERRDLESLFREVNEGREVTHAA